MRKRSIIKTIAGNVKRKATNAAITTAYIAMWGEKPKKGRKKKSK